MKVTINYDFFDAIKDINEPLHPLKIIRNRKSKYILLFPMGVAISYVAKLSHDINYDFRYWISYFTYLYGVNISAEILGALLGKVIFKNDKDYFGMTSARKLKQLVVLLQELNVNTDYELLLESSLYFKEHEFMSNDKMLPLLILKKYISIPSYNYLGEITETSILQEHVIGTKEYVLSIHEPNKQRRLSLVKNPS